MIFGASARAAAMSALRAGWRPWCADLFADADLRRIAPVTPIPFAEFPKRFATLMDNAPAGAWVYSGGLENHPRLVNAMAKKRRLMGMSGASLRALRSPSVWSRILRDANIACPAVAEQSPATDGTWLQKPKRSAAGRRIAFWPGGRVKRGYFLQQYIRGVSCSAVYVGDGNRAYLLGVTKQLVGETWLNASPFAYCGSVGPLPLSPTLHRRLQQLGDRLTAAFEVRGLFGVDFILAGQTPFPVEINPRYTASVECLEYAFRQPVWMVHRAAFDGGRIAAFTESTKHVVGKAILYAKKPLTFPAVHSYLAKPWSSDDLFAIPAFADIPIANEAIDVGKPILTVFSHGNTVAECCRLLREKAESVDRDFNQL